MTFYSDNVACSPKNLLQRTIPVMLLILVVFSYTTISFNKYLPFQEGWFQYYHMLMNEGKFPYRDFFIPIQPIFILLTDLITTLFGTSFIVLRWYGVIERVFLVVLVYIYLRKQFNDIEVFFFTLIGFFLYGSFNVDLPYSYYQTTLLFGFVGMFFLCNGIIFKNRILLNLYFSGFWTTVTFFTKQSSGLMLLLISVCIVILQGLRAETKYGLLKRLCAYFLGLLTVSTPILAWLHSNNALNNYYDQVYKSTTSKGSLAAILFGFIPRMFEHINIVTLLIVSLCLLLPLLSYNSLCTRIQRNNNYFLKYKFGLYTIIFILALTYPLISNKTINRILFVNSKLTRIILIVTFISVFITLVTSFLKWLQNYDNERNNFVLLTGLFCFGWMYGHGMSGVLEVHSLLPAFPFIMLLVFRLPHASCVPLSPEKSERPYSVGKVRWLPYEKVSQVIERKGLQLYNILKLFVMGTLLALVIIIASTRYATPYYWWGWGEPSIKTANLTSNIPALHKIKLSPESYAFYSEAYEKIIRNTGPHDEVFFFPHISALNVMTNRTHKSFAPITYFDVCSDKYAEMAANYLEKSPPKMIIYMDFPEEAWKIHETIFRGGKLSGQRKIQSIITNFKRVNRYEVIYSSKIPYNYPVEILNRIN